VNELSDSVRGVIFAIIAIAILFIWLHFFSPPVPQPQKGNQTTQAVAPGGTNATSSTSGTPGMPGTAQGTTASAAKPGSVPVMRAATEKVVVVESPLYRVELSNRGGVVLSWKLKKYLDDDKPPKPLDLVNHDSSTVLGWPFSLTLQDSQLESQANSELYQVTTAHSGAQAAGDASPLPSNSNEFEAPVSVIFHFSDGHIDVTKKLNFTEDYQLTVETSVSLDGKPLPAGLAWRGGFGDKEVYHASQLVTVFYSQTGKLNLLQYKKLGVNGNQTQPALQPGPLEFAGIEDQFFAATFIPDGLANMSLWHWTHNHSVIVDGKPEDQPVAEMAAGSQQGEALRLRLFVGPKDLALLSKVQPSLEGLVNFGFTGVIAKPLLFILQWLHRYISNWGWTIIALTLIINFALFPLKMKSWRSMQKMQKVAPEIRSIQDRYKKYSMNDPRKRKMNEEVMAVYQRESINPMGSCLPMLFQMPIWWALWRVLNGAIELRHAPFLGWIHDLSAKDPYYILPIAMAITMYLMTKMTPQTTVDPAQQKMMALMPLMFAAFFFTMSSGLNLYMFTSNIVGVGQQYYLNRAQPLPPKGKFKKKKNE
jgi:YidC/Oxa1 family membrane protein insertase